MESRIISKKEIAQIAKNTIADVSEIDVEAIDGEKRFVEDLSISSFEMFQLSYELEEKLKIELDVDDFMDVEKVDDFIEIIVHIPQKQSTRSA